MRRWGIVTTGLYALILVGLIVLGPVLTMDRNFGWLRVRGTYRVPGLWALQ